MSERKTEYVSVSVTREARDVLRSLAAYLSGREGRTLNLSEAVTIAAADVMGTNNGGKVIMRRMSENTTPDYAELAHAVIRHAEAHYDEGGWDVIVECRTLDEIRAELERDESVTDAASAIASFAPVVDVWADRQADARNSAF